MSARVDPWLLWLRALVVGSIAFAVGALGHVTAEGLLPSLPVLAVLLTICIALSAPLLVRQASSARLVTMLLTGQFGVHLMLTMTAGHRGDHALSATPTSDRALPSFEGPTLPVVDGRRVGSLADAYRVTDPGSSAYPEQAAPLPFEHLISDLAAHAPMMVAHAAAACVVGLWLACGEKTLWALLALLGRWVLASIRVCGHVAVPTASGLARLPDDARHVALPHWQTRPQPLRGPPVLAA